MEGLSVARNAFACWWPARRFGKTFLALTELIRAAWGPGRKAWYVAPTYRQAKRVAWKALKQMTKPYWAATTERNRSDD